MSKVVECRESGMMLRRPLGQERLCSHHRTASRYARMDLIFQKKLTKGVVMGKAKSKRKAIVREAQPNHTPGAQLRLAHGTFDQGQVS